MAFDFTNGEFEETPGAVAVDMTMAALHELWIKNTCANECQTRYRWIHHRASSDCYCVCNFGNLSETVDNRKFGRFVCDIPYEFFKEPAGHVQRITADPATCLYIKYCTVKCVSSYAHSHSWELQNMCRKICSGFAGNKVTLEIDGTDRLPVLGSDLMLWRNLELIDFCNIDFIELRGAFDESLRNFGRGASGHMRIYKTDLKPMRMRPSRPPRFWGTVTLAVDRHYDIQPFVDSPIFAEAGWNGEKVLNALERPGEACIGASAVKNTLASAGMEPAGIESIYSYAEAGSR